MKKQILNKIAQTLANLEIYNQSAEEAYKELLSCSMGCFNNLSAVYHFTEEEEMYVLADLAE